MRSSQARSPRTSSAKLALPVPTKVISDMLGVPYEDHEFFQEHANAGLARFAAADAMQKGAMSLHKYLIDLVEKKQANPAEDAVSDLAERVTAGEISVKEAAQLGTGLLIAGHETTANMIGIGVLALLENPEQAALLRDSDDPKFIANAAEELMRYNCRSSRTGNAVSRSTDIEIGGETIRKPVRASSSTLRLRTGTPPPTRIPTSWTSRGTPARNSASASAATSAWASSWPEPNFRSCSRRCCVAFRP